MPGQAKLVASQQRQAESRVIRKRIKSAKGAGNGEKRTWELPGHIPNPSFQKPTPEIPMTPLNPEGIVCCDFDRNV
jgi:hypothetical protein